MQRIKQWFFKSWANGGLGPDDYYKIKERIHKKNEETLGRMLTLTILLFGVLFVLSFFLNLMSHQNHLYGITLAILFVIYIVYHVVVKKRPKYSLIAWYATLAVVDGFGIILAVVNRPDIPSTAFCVLIFVGPLLVIDRPIRICAYTIAITVVFCIATVMKTEPTVWQEDLVNSLCFLTLSVEVNLHVTKMKLRDLVYWQYIEFERDNDDLTRLLTRNAMVHRIEKYITSTKEPAALIMIDIDEFKYINDTWGHTFGDVVLRNMGACIKEVFREGDILGRFGGDEFIVFLPYTKSEEAVIACVERLIKRLKEELKAPDLTKEISGSIGISMYMKDGESYDELFQKADKALYKAKRDGKDKYSFYEEAM